LNVRVLDKNIVRIINLFTRATRKIIDMSSFSFSWMFTSSFYWWWFNDLIRKILF